MVHFQVTLDSTTIRNHFKKNLSFAIASTILTGKNSGIRSQKSASNCDVRSFTKMKLPRKEHAKVYPPLAAPKATRAVNSNGSFRR